MILGLQSAILANYSFDQLVDYCSEVGFDSIEAMCWPVSKATRRYAGVTHINIDELDSNKTNEIKKKLRDKKIEISALGYYPNPLSSNKEEQQVSIEHLIKLITSAGDLGIDTVTTFVGRDKDKNVEDNLKLFKEVWTPIIKIAEEKKIKIAIENCPMLFSKDEWPGGNNLAVSPYVWHEMFELIPSDYFGLNYDPSHLVIMDMDYIKPIYEFKDKIFHVHFKDTKIYRKKLDRYGRFAYPLSYMSPKIPGLGDINWSNFCSALYDIGYKGHACIEVEDRAFESCEEDIKRAIELSYGVIRNYIK